MTELLIVRKSEPIQSYEEKEITMDKLWMITLFLATPIVLSAIVWFILYEYYQILN